VSEDTLFAVLREPVSQSSGKRVLVGVDMWVLTLVFSFFSNV
jgi:hypothetical protein